MEYQLRDIPVGESGTDQTVAEIIRLVRLDLGSPGLIARARSILSLFGCAESASRCEAEALYSWIGRNIRFVDDPVDVETVQSPIVTLRRGAGDCDDHSGLFVALALTLGLTVRLVVVGPSRSNFVHIFPEVFLSGSWVAADTTQPAFGFGWRPSGFEAEKRYSIQGGDGMPQNSIPVPRDVISKAVRAHVVNRLQALQRRGPLSADVVRSWARSIKAGSGGVSSETARAAAVSVLEGAAGSLPMADVGGSLGSVGSLTDIIDSVKGGLSDAYAWAQGAGTDIYNTGASIFGGGSRDPNAPLVALPDINITAKPSDSQVSAGISQALSSPTVLVGLGLLAVWVLKSFLSGRR